MYVCMYVCTHVIRRGFPWKPAQKLAECIRHLCGASVVNPRIVCSESVDCLHLCWVRGTVLIIKQTSRWPQLFWHLHARILSNSHPRMEWDCIIHWLRWLREANLLRTFCANLQRNIQRVPYGCSADNQRWFRGRLTDIRTSPLGDSQKTYAANPQHSVSNWWHVPYVGTLLVWTDSCIHKYVDEWMHSAMNKYTHPPSNIHTYLFQCQHQSTLRTSPGIVQTQRRYLQQSLPQTTQCHRLPCSLHTPDLEPCRAGGSWDTAWMRGLQCQQCQLHPQMTPLHPG